MGGDQGYGCVEVIDGKGWEWISNKVARALRKDLEERKHVPLLITQGKLLQIEETALPKPYTLAHD